MRQNTLKKYLYPWKREAEKWKLRERNSKINLSYICIHNWRVMYVNINKCMTKRSEKKYTEKREIKCVWHSDCLALLCYLVLEEKGVWKNDGQKYVYVCSMYPTVCCSIVSLIHSAHICFRRNSMAHQCK